MFQENNLFSDSHPLEKIPTSTGKIVHDKLRGGYYTPKEISNFLVEWAIQEVGEHVLEPSCGDGQFIESIVDAFGNSVRVTGIELFPAEAAKALMRGNKKTNIIVSDAFDWYIKNKPDSKFDVVVGNPPFIRYQNFPEEHRVRAFQIMKEEGLSPSRLTNAWLPFVVLATRALRQNGRLAMVLPAEVMQVTYAKELRKYLSTKYKKLNIVTFKRLVFANILQETVLLLGERGDCLTSSISLLEFEDLVELEHKHFASKKLQHKILDINHDNEKWTQYYLTREELELIRSIETSDKFIRLGDIADVDVGVVTGNNEFFILHTEKAVQLGIMDQCVPIVSKSNQLSGTQFTKKDYQMIADAGGKILLFNPGKITRDQLTDDMLNYIKYAENSGVTDGYKCRIRLPNWWNVPSVWKPDAFLLRQIYEGPKIIVNQTNAISTDTIHRVRMTADIPAKVVAAIALNSLTFALAEIRGRSYGGGVLELEPTEAENLLLPRLNSQTQIPFDEIDKLVREKKTTQALNLVDSVVLKGVGLKTKEIQTLREIWNKLRNRRSYRNSSGKKK